MYADDVKVFPSKGKPSLCGGVDSIGERASCSVILLFAEPLFCGDMPNTGEATSSDVVRSISGEFEGLSNLDSGMLSCTELRMRVPCN